MKFGFDAKRFFNNFTGLGNYSRFVIDALSEHAPKNEYFLYTPKAKDHPEYRAILQRSNLHVVTPPAGYRFFAMRSLWRTWGISKEPSVKALDLFHGLSQELPISLPTKVRKVVTVHDLIFIRYPELYNPMDVRIYKAKVKAACNHADRILATSNQTKQDVVEFLKVDPAKVEVTYQGCHPNFKKEISSSHIQSIKTKYQLPAEYILNVGTIEARKNVSLLVQALALLPKDLRTHIVIIGRSTEYKKEIIETAHRAGVIEWLIFLHGVSFEDLPAIYQGSRLFVYPSIFEGFGIPIVEALESSIPVISTTGSCLSEAGGPGSVYVNPHDPRELADQIQKILSHEEIRKQMIDLGKQHVKMFAPKVIAEKLMSVYQSVLDV